MLETTAGTAGSTVHTEAIPRGIDLADVYALVAGSDNLEPWRRDQLLAEIRALATFHVEHRPHA